MFAKIVSLTYEKGTQWLLFSLIAIRNYPFDHPYIDKLFELVEKGVVAKDFFMTFWSFSRIDKLSTPEAVGFLERVLKLPDSFEMVLHMVMSQYLEQHPATMFAEMAEPPMPPMKTLSISPSTWTSVSRVFLRSSRNS